MRVCAGLLSRAKFGFVPRGDAIFSYRLLETMSFGVIPVIIADGWALPFGEHLLDWWVFSQRS